MSQSAKLKAFLKGSLIKLTDLVVCIETFGLMSGGSNTENKLRINVEADTQEILDQVLEKISSSI